MKESSEERVQAFLAVKLPTNIVERQKTEGEIPRLSPPPLSKPQRFTAPSRVSYKRQNSQNVHDDSERPHVARLVVLLRTKNLWSCTASQHVADVTHNIIKNGKKIHARKRAPELEMIPVSRRVVFNQEFRQWPVKI